MVMVVYTTYVANKYYAQIKIKKTKLILANT